MRRTMEGRGMGATCGEQDEHYREFQEGKRNLKEVGFGLDSRG